MLAEVPLEANGPQMRVAGVEPLEDPPRAVGRSVVDGDHLVRSSQGVQRSDGLPVDLFERARLVEDRHDDRDLRAPFLVGKGIRVRCELALPHGVRC